jgi:hypothetical protein
MVFRIGLPREPREFLRHITGNGVIDFNAYHVARQELWYMDVDDIQKRWETMDDYTSLFEMYRILEHIIGADVIVIEEDAGDVIVYFPQCPSPYVWRPSFNRALIVAHARVNEYEITYEIVASGVSSPYTMPWEPLYKEVTRAKARATAYDGCDDIATVHDVEQRQHEIQAQYVNDKGKVVLVLDRAGDFTRCLTRPMLQPAYVSISDIGGRVAEYAATADILDLEASAMGGISCDGLFYPPARSHHVRVKDRQGCVTFVGEASYAAWKQLVRESK